MARLQPFKGIRYNARKVKDISHVISPPYDVISKREQEDYCKRSRYNVVRLILGRQYRAASLFKRWLNKGILEQDAEPSVYVYRQSYSLADGRRAVRTGFIALTYLEDYGGTIRPHERTLPSPVEDRLHLIRTCRANFSPIFSLYSDPDRRVDKILKVEGSPLFVLTKGGDKDEFWRISSSTVISQLLEEMQDKELFIADGHHRYKAALTYRNEMRKNSSFTPDDPSNYVMMYLTHMEGAGLTILPTHRLIHDLGEISPNELKEELAKYFLLDKKRGQAPFLTLPKNKGVTKEGRKHIFGMFLEGADEFTLLTLKDSSLVDNLFPSDVKKEEKVLDVAILHAILKDILGDAVMQEGNISYVVDPQAAVETVTAGRCKVAFFLNPTKISQVKEIAIAGGKMPGKATYFYPKVPSGLVFYKF